MALKLSLLLTGILLGLVLTGCGNPQEPDAGSEVQDTPVPTLSEAAAAPVTPIPGLTDTGFTAPDGRPLYKECIQEGAPLPPEIPTPSSTQIVDPSPTPGDPNAGKSSPSSDQLPPLDPRLATPSDASSWILYQSKCYGYSLKLPTGWKFDDPPFIQSGYQQGETGAMVSGDGRARISLSVFYTPIDMTPSLAPISPGPDIYVLSDPVAVERSGRIGRETYAYVTGTLSGVWLNQFYKLRDDWYLGITAFVEEPYSEQSIADVRAVLDSLEFGN
jgi:hypothetical protein